MVFVDVRTFLFLTFVRYTRTHDFAQTIDVVTLQTETFFDFLAHVFCPRFSTERTDTQADPRLDHIVTASMNPEDLGIWVNEVVVPRAKLAWKGKGDLVPGDHCKFCQVKAKCAALANLAYEAAQQEFKPGEPESTISDDQLASLAEKFKWIEEWMAAARAYMLQRALEGKPWPGLKLVESRTIRKWSNEQEARKKLIAEGYSEDEFTQNKLKGIGDIEKLVGKKEFQDLLGEWVEKPKGDPTLVPESDKREALPAPGVSQAAMDFDELM